MFIPQVALEPVPEHSEVEQDALTGVLRRMTASNGALRVTLENGFRDMERRQPALAEFLSAELAELEHPAAQTLSFFLFVVVYLAFNDAFGPRLQPVSGAELDTTLSRLIADGELRHSGVARESYSEDLVALGQPALMRLLREEIDRAIEQVPDSNAWKSVDPLYEVLLVQILVLSHAVAPMQ